LPVEQKPPSPVERHSLLLVLTGVWTMGGIVLYLLTPLTAPALLPLCVLAPAAWFLARERRLPLYRPSAAINSLALAGIYLLVNASWSLSPQTAYFALAFYFLFILTVHITVSTLHVSDGAVLRAMAAGFWVAFAVGGAVLCVETLSDQWLRRQLLVYLPAARPDARLLEIQDGRVTYIAPYLLNRSIAALTVLVWPAVFIAVLLGRTPRARAWLMLALLPVVAAIFRSAHATSKIAFVGAAATFGAFLIVPALAKRAITAGWVAAFVLVVPLAALAYQSQLYRAAWLPHSAQHRIVIWGHTSHLIAEAPVLGAGIHAARALNDPTGYGVPVAPGTEFRLTTGLHSHNVFLQTWYEAGMVGVALLLGVGLLILGSLNRAPTQVQPYVYATFAACALMGGSSFSLWQPWFMASLGFAAVFATLGWSLATRGAAGGNLNGPGGAGL
jgi:O-Antigen ligase